MSREEFERKAQALWEEVVLTSGIDIADPAELVRKQVEIALAPAWSERLLDQETSKVIAVRKENQGGWKAWRARGDAD